MERAKLHVIAEVSIKLCVCEWVNVTSINTQVEEERRKFTKGHPDPVKEEREKEWKRKGYLSNQGWEVNNTRWSSDECHMSQDQQHEAIAFDEAKNIFFSPLLFFFSSSHVSTGFHLVYLCDMALFLFLCSSLVTAFTCSRHAPSSAIDDTFIAQGKSDHRRDAWERKAERGRERCASLVLFFSLSLDTFHLYSCNCS